MPVPPANGEAGPVALELPPKPIPLPLSGQLNPSAFITNLWLSVRLCSRGFTRSELLLIARSLPKSELGVGASQPVVFRMQRPACTAVLSPTGSLSIMGGITKEQALWQAYRVAYKLKYRVWWKPVEQVWCDFSSCLRMQLKIPKCIKVHQGMHLRGCSGQWPAVLLLLPSLALLSSLPSWRLFVLSASVSSRFCLSQKARTTLQLWSTSATPILSSTLRPLLFCN